MARDTENDHRGSRSKRTKTGIMIQIDMNVGREVPFSIIESIMKTTIPHIVSSGRR